jgi:putative flavoprotein involved in K+ transport
MRRYVANSYHSAHQEVTMCSERLSERVQTIVIGGGQAGLSVGYHLSRLGRPYLILDANARIGDSWRQRWDSLRLFTPARFDSLAGMPFPAAPNEFPTKDQMGDYLEEYAHRFKLRVRTHMKVDRISRRGDTYLVEAGDRRFKADHVVVAMAKYQRPWVPAFAQELDPRIVQLHSCDYRNRSQLAPGSVLIAGAGNSGAEIARELARDHKVWLSGRDVGQIPFRLDSVPSRVFLARLVLRFLFHRVLTMDTPVGRKAREKMLHKGGPLIRVKSKHLTALRVERLPKVVGVRDGLPVLDGGQTVDVANIVWCTGFRAGFSWVDLPVFGTDGLPIQHRGVVASEPGLYFVGLHFLYALSSTMIHGVGRDAEYVAQVIAERTRNVLAA